MILTLKGVLADGSLPAGTIEPLLPTAQRIEIPRGEDAVIHLVVQRSDGSRVDLAGFTAIRFAVRCLLADASAMFTREAVLRAPTFPDDPDEWTAFVTLDSIDTLGLIEKKNYHFDVQLTDGSGKRWQGVPNSVFHILPIVSQPDEPILPPLIDLGAPIAIGPPGLSILNGIGPPDDDDGRDGEWYVDRAIPAALVMYGPKTAGAWGAGYPFGGGGAGSTVSTEDPLPGALVADPGAGPEVSAWDHVHPYALAVASVSDGYMSDDMAQQLADLVAADFGAQIADVTADLAALTTTVGGLTSDLAALTTTVGGHTTTLASHTSSISTLTTGLATANTNITTNTSNISSLTTTVSGHTTSITTLTSGLAAAVAVNVTQTADIATNTSNIASLTSTVAGLSAVYVPQTRTITPGAGLVGSAALDLSANRTLAVGANADGSITVNADDIQVGVLATDTQHGNRGGGGLHADVVAGGASGFMSGTQATQLATNTSNIATNTTNIATNTTNITTLQGRTLSTTGPITGGGTIGTTNLTIAISAASGSAAGSMAAADFTKVAGIAALTTKGDLLGYSTVPLRVAVGTDGQVLTADAASAPGWKWAAAAGGGADALGSYIVQTATNKPTNAQVLASLATGMVQVTTATGALSSFVPSANTIPKGSGGLLVDSTLTLASNVLTHAASSAAGTVSAVISNTDNTSTSSHALLTLLAGGASGGNPRILFDITGGTSTELRTDNTTSDTFQILRGTSVAFAVSGVSGGRLLIATGGAPLAAVDLGVRSTSANETQLFVLGATSGAGGYAQLTAQGGSSTSNIQMVAHPAAATSTVAGVTKANLILVSDVGNVAGSAMLLGTLTNIPVYLAANNVARMFLKGDGNIALTPTITSGVDASTYGGGVKVVFVGNATTEPTTEPTAGGLLWAFGTKIKVRGAGTDVLANSTVASGASAAWDAINYSASTLTLSGSTNVTTATGVNLIDIKRPTITSASAVTVSAAATLRIANAPLAAGSTTLTKAYSLWIDDGLPRIDSTTPNGAVLTSLTGVGPTGASTTVQEWFTLDVNGTTRFIPCF